MGNLVLPVLFKICLHSQEFSRYCVAATQALGLCVCSFKGSVNNLDNNVLKYRLGGGRKMNDAPLLWVWGWATDSSIRLEGADTSFMFRIY